MGQALMVLVHRRIGEVCGKMERMVARFRAGTLRIGVKRDVQPILAGAVTVGLKAAGRTKVARIWPMRFAWLTALGGWKVAGVGAQMQAALEHPDMKALLVAAPQARRVLMPLCRALGVPVHLLRPGTFPVEAVPKPPVKRVYRTRQTVEAWIGGRTKLPRGVLAAARRAGFGKIPRG